ncbi:MAG: site-specific DNA-methyltransferase [Pyrinomonadaceae bacterium]
MPETIHELMPETSDLNAERLATLKALLPDIFSDEGKINETELRKIVEEVPSSERYEFNWFGKTKAKHEAFTPTRLTLTFDEARSVNADKSENIIIEGENLEVLKLLLRGYRDQIKCIYIDPPYNTGKDYVYSDKHVTEYHEYLERTHAKRDGIKIDANPESSGRFHSEWLSMMFSRFLVAQQLLRDDGVIFISIDDNESHNLRKLCDEVFGRRNFLTELVWKKKYIGGKHAKHFVDLHEYIVVYAKDVDSIGSFLMERPDREKEKFEFEDEYFEERGKYYTRPLKSNLAERKTLIYPIELPDGTCTETQWMVARTTFDRLVKEGRIIFKKGKDGNYTVYRKFYEFDNDGNVKIPSIIDDVANADGKVELKDLFKIKEGRDIPFDNPKPTKLIKHLIKPSTEPGDIVLDFFAGGGTTGHAVMDLDEVSDRVFILIQLPELTPENSPARRLGFKTVSQITIERNKLAAAKILAEKRRQTPKLFGNGNDNPDDGLGFKVFTLEKSYFPRTEWTPVPEMSDEEKITSLRAYIDEKEKQLKIDFDRDKLLTEVLIKEGFKLTYKAEKIAEFTENEVLKVTDSEKEAVVCLDETLSDATVEQLRKLIDNKVVVIERALDTTKKWNLHNSLGEKFKAF